jgi:cation diffusion facilitator CzcD-associated flavoprotein CzcO
VEALRRRLPAALSDSVARWRSILLGELFFRLSRVMPETMRRALIEDVQKALGPSFDVAKHFTPNYNVWDQRVCLIADGDFYAGLRDGKVSIVTDRVARFTQTGLLLESGQEIDADLIVTATGLELQMMGGAEIEVDGRRVDFSKLLMYKGCMYTGVPNLAGLSGHTNASWTLKVELTCGWLCRLLARMDAVGAARCTPHRNDPSVREEPLLEFSSGYVQRALSSLPKQGSKAPFRLYQSYLLDLLLLRLGKIEDANLEFAGASSALRPPSYTTTRWRAHPRIRAAARAPS